MFNAFNGFWKVDTGPAGWKFYPGMEVKTLAMCCAVDKAYLGMQATVKADKPTNIGSLSFLLTLQPSESSGTFVYFMLSKNS